MESYIVSGLCDSAICSRDTRPRMGYTSRGRRVRRGAKWGRCHNNGWIVLVVYEGAGSYGYTVLQPGKLVAAALETHIVGTLTEAQTRAERIIPEHGCQCQDWKRLSAR